MPRDKTAASSTAMRMGEDLAGGRLLEESDPEVGGEEAVPASARPRSQA